MYRALLLAVCCALLTAGDGPGPRPGPVLFPADAVVDLSQPPYAAVGDGRSDVTAALQQAMEDNANGDVIIYLPAGTWLISDTIKWGQGKRGGLEQKRIILQGAGADRTTLRLKDGSPGFQKAEAAKGGETCKPMLWTGRKPAQRFRNGIRDLTVDIGSGNPAATAIQYIANNQGSLRDVRIVAPAGEGSIGLDLGYTDEQGPCLIQRVRIEGFRTGIRLASVVNSVTFHQIALLGQSEAGIANDGQTISIEGLWARLDAPALISRQVTSFVTIEGADLHGAGKTAAAGPALRSTGYLAARGVKSTGFACAIEQGSEPKKPDPKAKPGTPEASPPPPPPPVQVPSPVDEWYSHAPYQMLGAAPKALRLKPAPTPVEPLPAADAWASPAAFGGIAGDEIDDTEALQKAVDSGKPAVYLPRGAWRLDGELQLRGKVELFTAGEGRLAGAGRIVLADGERPAVHIARLDLIYQGIGIEQRSRRELVISGITMGKGEFHWTGSGAVHFEDVCMGSLTVPAKAEGWARQLNIEVKGGHKILVDGGSLRVLGYKTEQAGICLEVRAGGKAEIVGGFIYAQGAAKDTPMLICRDASLSATLSETCWNFAKQGYGTLAEAEIGGKRETLAGGAAAGRLWHSNGASAVPLLRVGK